MINHNSPWPTDLTVLFLWSNISCKRTKSSLNLICILLFQKDRGDMMDDRIGSTLLKRIEEAVQDFFLSKLIFCLLKITYFKIYYHTIKIQQPAKCLYRAESVYTFIMEWRYVLYAEMTLWRYYPAQHCTVTADRDFAMEPGYCHGQQDCHHRLHSSQINMRSDTDSACTLSVWLKVTVSRTYGQVWALLQNKAVRRMKGVEISIF